MPAVFTIAGQASRRRGQVPAFLSIELTGVSDDGASHTLTLSVGKARHSLAIPPGGRASKVVTGLKRASTRSRWTAAIRGAKVAEPGP